MSDLSKLTKAQLLKLIEGANVPVAPAGEVKTSLKRGRKAKGAKPSFTKHLTESFTLVEDRRSGTPEGTNAQGENWAAKYAELAFCDAEGNAHTGALREDDTLGHELRAEIKDYGKTNAIGRSRMRFNRKIGAWTAPLAMFPPRLRKLAGI